MVKKVLVLLMIGLITVLAGCEPYYEIYRLRGRTVTKVELIYYDNPEARENPSAIYCFDWDKLEIISTLDESRIEDFVSELVNNISFGIPTSGILNSQDGKGIRITYGDNTSDIITLTTISTINEDRFYYSSFDENNNLVSGRDIYAIRTFADEFIEFLDRYFPVE